MELMSTAKDGPFRGLRTALHPQREQLRSAETGATALALADEEHVHIMEVSPNGSNKI